MARVWVRDDEQAWVPARVTSDTEDEVVAKKENGEEVTLPKKGKNAEEIVEVDETGLGFNTGSLPAATPWKQCFGTP